MTDEAQYTVKRAHLHFTTSLNGLMWELLATGGRTAQDDCSNPNFQFPIPPLNYPRETTQ